MEEEKRGLDWLEEQALAFVDMGEEFVSLGTWELMEAVAHAVVERNGMREALRDGEAR